MLVPPILALSQEFLEKYVLQQDPREFGALLELAKQCDSILEIGSCLGGSMKALTRAMPRGARIVSVDWCKPEKFGETVDVEMFLQDAASEIRAEGYDAHVIVGNSTDPNIIKAVCQLGPYDLCFIDGDHSTEGVRADWTNYGPMAEAVAFHDIMGCPGPNRLWAELRSQYVSKEFITKRPNLMGIGVLLKKESR